ncbi:MAG: phosphotransacetylase [bacterium]|jgi:phosphate acetyltransferase|nr:phosphotransacetylase [bacterium]
MDVMDKIRAVAKRRQGGVVLFEGWDNRIVEGGCRAAAEGLARVSILGQRAKLEAVAVSAGVSLDGVDVIDHSEDEDRLTRFAERFIALREAKGKKPPSLQDAVELVGNPNFFAAMMVDEGLADGYLGGADTTTANTLRPALQVIGCAAKGGLVTSYFLMVLPEKKWGKDGLLVFGDSAIVPDPDAGQLAQIGVAIARAVKKLLEFDPRVAFLSFSTKGSANHPAAVKVIEAVEKARSLEPEIVFDGELQADAALLETVAAKKDPGGVLKGRANVLVFPNLEAGNIGYKLVQRLAGAQAIGPIVAGLKKPVNDLSRGCSVEDVVNMLAVTSAMC